MEISTGSSGSLAFAKEWAEKCAQSHSRCNTGESNEKPARLLELTPDSELCRLRTVSEMRVCPRYATLSHCWGKIEMFKLELDNFDFLCRGVPMWQLCKTFRDAVKAT